METLEKNLHLGLLALFLIITAGIWLAVVREERGGTLTVAFLDVGQGDSIYIEAPNGTQALIDSGGGKAVLRALGDVMPMYDRSLDLLIGTHPDQDHIGGFPFIFERYKVGQYMDPGIVKDTGTYRELLRYVNNQGIPYTHARRGQKIVLDDGIILTVLFPDRTMQGKTTNNASVVAELTYGDASFLFTGDAPQAVEEYLVFLEGNKLDVDVLKAGHHGSRTSTGVALLQAASPQFVAVSAGVKNRYGHPHRETLERIAVVQARVLGTYERGTIMFKTDGTKIGLK